MSKINLLRVVAGLSKTFSLICMMLMVGSVWAQTAASATWALTTDGSVANSGAVTGTAQAWGSQIATPSYGATNGCSAGASASNNGWSNVSQTSTAYYEYAVAPNSGNTLTVNSVSFYYSVSGGSMNLSVFYSLDNFATSTQLGSTVTGFSNTASTVQFTSTPSIVVSSGQTLKVRVFGWAASATTRTFRNKTAVISGTTIASPTVNAVIGTNEYGTQTDGNNQQTNSGSSTVTYMTWDNTNLYVGVTGATVSEGYVLYLDKDPQIPVNGGTNANGTNVGNNYDGESFAVLPFRADLVIYAKNGYREYRTADGSNGWSGATSGFGSYADNSGTKVREFSIPWSAIGGIPASFNWFGFATSSTGYVYGGTPVENPGATIGTSARYERYYTVSTTTVGAYTMPFSRNSYVFNNTGDETGFGSISVYDFTMNSSGRLISRSNSSGGNWTVNGNLVVGAGTIYFGSAGGSSYGTTSVNNVNINGGNLNMDNTNTAMTVTGNLAMSSGSLTLSAQVGGDMNLAGNWNVSGGTFTHNNRQVQFNGASAQTLTGSGTTAFSYLKMNNSTGLTLQASSPISVAGVLTMTSGNIVLNGNNLTMGSGATVSGGSAASYIVTSSSGNYIATTNATQATCPIGNSSIYAPLKITGTSTSDTYATYLTSTQPCTPTTASQMVNLAWGITSATQVPASVLFQWNSTDQAVSFTPTGTCDIGRYNSACPYNIAAIGSAAGTSPNTITASAGLASGSNIYVIGNTNAVYFVTPALSTNGASSLTFSTTQTVGTQTVSQSFNLSGTNLTGSPGNITVTAPSTDFQVSNNNSTWGATTTIAYSSATLASTPVYVRFSPQSTGAKSGSLTLSGGGVSSPPSISLTGTAVTGTLSANGTASLTFANQVSLTQSASQTFNLSGSNLLNGSGNITVNAPSTDFQVSNNNSTWGSSTTIAYSSTTLASTPVYVRFTPQSVGAKSGNITFSGGNVGTPPTVALTGTGTLPTPVATAATNYTATGFNANWGAVTGASAGYLLDVSTSPNFAIVGTATATEGFESGMPTVGYNTGTYSLGSGSWAFVNIIRGTIINSGSYSCQMQGGTSSSITSPSYNGMGTVTLYAKPGVNPTSITVSKIVGGVTTLLQTINLTGGAAYAQFTVNVNDNTNGVQLFVQNTGSNVGYLDDISIGYNTVTPSFVTGYNALAVSGQSTITQAVTGLTAGTYYYRLRATDGTNISLYSDTVTVTIQDPNTANYQSATSGNYSTASTWNYDVSGSGSYIAATQAPGANNSVTILNGHTVTLTANQTLNSGKTITVNGGGILNASTFNVNGAGNVTISSGATLVSGDVNGINASGTNTGSIQVTGTRTYNSGANYGYTSISGNTGNFFSVTSIANTVSNLLIGYGGAGGNITYNGSSASITTTTLSLVKGSFLLGAANTVNITNGGSVICTAGSMATTGAGGSDGGTINFQSGASASGISYPTSSSASFYNVTLNGSNASGYYLGGGNTTINGTLQINGSFVQGGTAPVYSSTSTLNYNTAGAYTAGAEWYDNTASGAGVPQNVTTTTAGTSLNFGSFATYHQMSGNLNIGSGTFFALSNAAGGDLYIKGNWTRAATGTFTPNVAAVNFNGSSVTQTISVTGAGTETYGYLIVNNSNGVQLSSSPATNVSISATTADVLQLTGGNLDLNGRTLTFTADGGNIKVTGARTITSTTAATISVQGNKTVTYATSGNNLTLDANITTILQGKYLNFGNPSAGNYTYINGTLQINANGYVSSYAPYYNSGSTLVYNTGGPYSPSQEWYENTFVSQPGIPYNVTVSNNTSLNFNGHGYPFEMWGNLIINSGSSFALNTGGSPSPDLYIRGNWNNSGTFTTNGHLVKFDGSTPQTLTGATTFDYFQIANSAGLTLNNDITIGTGGFLTTGIITTGTNNVIVTSNSGTALSGQSSSSYIKGNLQRAVTSSTTYDFPLGSGSAYELATITVNSLSGMSSISGKFTTGLPATGPSPSTCKINNTPITGMLDGGYWTLTPNAGSANYDLTLNEGGYSGTPSVYHLGLIKRHDASSPWLGTDVSGTNGYHSNSNSSINSGVASVKRTGITSFSDYGIGSSSNYALPVTLIYFTADNKEDNGELAWATAAEINNDHFDIERSLDGVIFTKIGQVAGHGNSTATIEYGFSDPNLTSHGVSVLYYRLKQVDVDGNFEYTNIASVDVSDAQPTFHIISTYPNPFADHFSISFFSPSAAQVKMAVYDVRGAVVSEEVMSASEGMNVYSTPNANKLPAGFYTMNVTATDRSYSIKMLKGGK